MAKKKQSKEEAKLALTTAKEERKAAREELRAFEKENSLAKDEDHSADAKVGKKWKKLNDAFQKKNAAVEAAETELTDAKSSDKTPRASKYEYPLGEGGKEMTAIEKKKYRTKMRAEAKKKEKGETEPKKSKKKADAAAEEGATEAAAKGKSATKKKKVKAAEAVDQED